MARDKRKTVTDRDREKIAKKLKKSVGCGSVFSAPRALATRKSAPIRLSSSYLFGVIPAPSVGRDAIKRSDKTAMFICGESGEKKEKDREKCRVEGEIYLPAARADKIIRQKMPGVDDDEAKEGSRRKRSGISQVRTKEERESEERKRRLER